MNRDQLQRLTRERILDAQALIDGGRWAFAYYNVGYAVECALKACFLARMPITGWVFRDKVKIDECRTHDFKKLVELSGLYSELTGQFAINSAVGGAFQENWDVVNLWKVDDRYSLSKTEQEAKAMVAAITDQPDGVLEWIMKYW